MATLKKYDKDLKREITVTTSIPSEINQLKHEGFAEVKPKTTQQSNQQSGKQDSKK